MELEQMAEYALVRLGYYAMKPLAKSAGDAALSSAKKTMGNVARIFRRTKKTLEKRGKVGGVFSSRVLKDTVEQACFCEDEVQEIYLAGVLASSKTSKKRDDRAVAYLAILRGLSTYQIRTHALLYSAILKMSDEDFNKGRRSLLRADITVLISERHYRKAMEFKRGEATEAITQHTFIGLEQQGLSEGGRLVNISSPTRFGTLSMMRHPVRQSDGTIKHPEPLVVKAPFRYFHPTPLGIELFLWGLGYGDKGASKYTPDLLKRVKVPVSITPIDILYGHVTLG